MNDQNVAGAMRAHLQTLPTRVLAAAARGELDLNTGARCELANRGLDLNGEYIGMPAAQMMHTAAPLRHHAAALEAAVTEAMIGVALAGAAPDAAEEKDALLLQAAANAMHADDEENLSSVLRRADTAVRERILEFIHPLHWRKLGCPPIDLNRSLVAYVKKFGAGE